MESGNNHDKRNGEEEVKDGLIAHIQSTSLEAYNDKDLQELEERYNHSPGTALLLESVGSMGSVAFILCAATDDYFDMEDANDVRTGELRVYSSLRLALIMVQQGPVAPQPNRAQRRRGATPSLVLPPGAGKLIP
jgi:hypothetical protein